MAGAKLAKTISASLSVRVHRRHGLESLLSIARRLEYNFRELNFVTNNLIRRRCYEFD